MIVSAGMVAVGLELELTCNKRLVAPSPTQKEPSGCAALAVQPDGSFWVGDGATSRLLHVNSSFNPTATIPADTIMFLPHDGWTSVDPNDPRRVIGDSYLEFDVDYTKPLQQAWSLKKNWAVGLDPKYLHPAAGINSVSTLSGGVYGTLNDPNSSD